LYEPAAWKNMGRLVGVHPDRPVSAEAVVAIAMTLNAELQSSARAASRFCLFCRNRSQHIAQRFPAKGAIERETGRQHHFPIARSGKIELC
jgi:hypothetical protein